jgi:N-acetylmuramoyl-L-alanine amidase
MVNLRSAVLLSLALSMVPMATVAEEAAEAAVTACDSAHFRIALDVGHTARVYGQLSARGVPEFEFNKNLAGIVVQALHNAGFPLAEMRDPGEQ